MAIRFNHRATRTLCLPTRCSTGTQEELPNSTKLQTHIVRLVAAEGAVATQPSRSITHISREVEVFLFNDKPEASAAMGHAVACGLSLNELCQITFTPLLTMLLSSQFQGFCRDLHSEGVDHIVRSVTPLQLRAVLRAEFE